MYHFLSKSATRSKSLSSSKRRRHPHRSHSPNSPRSGSAGGGVRGSGGKGHADDLLAASKPVQDLAYHVRQVKNALTHFKDVILKNKLEMLPGNGTVVLELIANVHTGEFVKRQFSRPYMFVRFLFVCAFTCFLAAAAPCLIVMCSIRRDVCDGGCEESEF